MSSLEQIKADIKSEIKVNEKGIGYATVRGCGRLVDVQHSTLLRAFAGDKNPGKLAQLLMEHGFDVVSFPTVGIPDLAVALIAKYYAFYAGARCTGLAKLADLAFSGMGVRAWFQELVGWEKSNVTSSIIKVDDEIEAILTALLDNRRQIKAQNEEIKELQAWRQQEEVRKLAAEKAFTEAPLPEVVTPAMEVRTQINRLVRDFCFATGCEHQFAWRQLYREFRDLYHIDLYARAKNSGCSKLDICEALGMLKDLYAVAHQLFGSVAANG